VSAVSDLPDTETLARLRAAIHEATDPEYLWNAMYDPDDEEANLTDFAHAASRAIRAVLGEAEALAAMDGAGKLDAELRANALAAHKQRRGVEG